MADEHSKPLWFVAHTRPRCEKKLATFCEEQGLAHKLPLLRSVKRYQGRTLTFHKPLFSGYVFLHTEPSQRALVEQNKYVANLLVPPDQTEFEHQLKEILRALDTPMEIRLAPIITEGIAVRIVSGPLRGLDGRVMRRDGPVEVYLHLDFIGQAAVVRLPADVLDPI
jgi:transcription antitermination factor NusG